MWFNYKPTHPSSTPPQRPTNNKNKSNQIKSNLPRIKNTTLDTLVLIILEALYMLPYPQ